MPHTLTNARAAVIARAVAMEFGVHADELPNLVIFITTRSGALAEGIPITTPIVVDHIKIGNSGDSSVYNLWLIGTDADVALVKAIATAVNDERKAGKTAEQIADLTRHVCTRLDATVSASDLAQEQVGRDR